MGSLLFLQALFTGQKLDLEQKLSSQCEECFPSQYGGSGPGAQTTCGTSLPFTVDQGAAVAGRTQWDMSFPWPWTRMSRRTRRTQDPMGTGICLILFSYFIEMLVPPEHSTLSLRSGCVVLMKVCDL